MFYNPPPEKVTEQNTSRRAAEGNYFHHENYWPKHQHSISQFPREIIAVKRRYAMLYVVLAPKKLLAKTPALVNSSSEYFGRAASRRAIAQYLSGRGEEQYFNTFSTARPERILAHIPHALRLVHSADKSGDRSRSARQKCLRAGKCSAPPHRRCSATSLHRRS